MGFAFRAGGVQTARQFSICGQRSGPVHIAYSVLFLLFVGLSETMRHGVFGLTPSEMSMLSHASLLLLALILLRGDVVFLLRRPGHDLYDDRRLGWSWRRTALGLAVAPALWIAPVSWALASGEPPFTPFAVQNMPAGTVATLLVFALAQTLFLREAAIKAFHADIRAIYLVSVLSCFIFYLPQGLPAAMVGAGVGAFLLTLRLIGTNPLVVACIHAINGIMLTEVLAPGPSGTGDWNWSACILAASALLSVLLFQVLAAKRRRTVHA
ncbi:MAG TPA: hypothetical protein DEA05_14515 [Rhodobacteraceae bacterium]|nr:hypothetical protein [Paracoccaceae bacterium]